MQTIHGMTTGLWLEKVFVQALLRRCSI